jgi:hypothetical protein
MDVNTIGKKYAMIGGVAFLSAILLFSMTASSASAHMRQLVTIGGKRYLLEVGSQVEPPYVGDKNAVDFFAWTPDPHDPLNDSAKGIKNLTGLDKTVSVIVSAGPVSKRLDFTPNPSNTAQYDATFYPTAQTTYTYTLVGKINNTPIHISYRCVPGAGDDTPGNNTKATVSAGVVRLMVAGGYACPVPRVSIP